MTVITLSSIILSIFAIIIGVINLSTLTWHIILLDLDEYFTDPQKRQHAKGNKYITCNMTSIHNIEHTAASLNYTRYLWYILHMILYPVILLFLLKFNLTIGSN